MSSQAVKDVVCRPTDRPIVFLDNSIKSDGDYNVQVNGDNVVVMSKNLNEYYGEYAGVIKLDAVSSRELKKVLLEMIAEEQFEHWLEDIIVRMIFRNDYAFYYQDIMEYDWTEVDSVDDLVKAKKIHCNS
jgi:choline kinase